MLKSDGILVSKMPALLSFCKVLIETVSKPSTDAIGDQVSNVSSAMAQVLKLRGNLSAAHDLIC